MTGNGLAGSLLCCNSSGSHAKQATFKTGVRKESSESFGKGNHGASAATLLSELQPMTDEG